MACLGEPTGLCSGWPSLAMCLSKEKAAPFALCCTGRSVAYLFIGREAIRLISTITSLQSS